MKYQIVWIENNKPFDNETSPPIENKEIQLMIMADIEEEIPYCRGKLQVIEVKDET